ncbi:MAG TPA: exonuclease domain-containing protein [Pyrinomonadaceae bacterium]|nr:exonuclease domain-containing protein [Pyrinomonadaceae bacterium]
MSLPRNLVPDSALVDETFALVRENGGRASFAQITDSILRLSNADDHLAASLVAELIQNDPRFAVEPDHLRAVDDERDAQSLLEAEFVVLDVEAVHDRKTPARIIEIGAYRVRGGQILDDFETLINPETTVPRFVTGLTGISTEMLTTAPKFADVAEDWLNFIGDAVLVAHNSSFDLPLLNREIARVFPGYRLKNCDLCTVDLARRLVPQLESFKLDSLAAYFGFEIPRRHRAADDALATARVFVRLLQDLSTNGITRLAEARSFQTKLAKGELHLAFDA